MLTVVILSGILVVVSLPLLSAFNVDTTSARLYKQGDGTMFGYTVAEHTDGNNKWLLVGAPRAQTRQPGIHNGGAIYKCSTSNQQCSQLVFDEFGNQKDVYNQMEEKSNQSFGATLYSTGLNGRVIACAPLYVLKRGVSGTHNYLHDPVGNCFVADSTLTIFKKYSPCFLPLRHEGIFVEKACLAGFSAVLPTDKRTLFMGAVNSFYGQGQLFSQNLNVDDDPFTETSEYDIKFDYSYMGYAMAVGNFTTDGLEDLAVGVPRGDDFRGNVTLFSHELQYIQSLTGGNINDCGRQSCIGEFFGYSIAVSDFNGDGLADIAVGAPFYSRFPYDLYESGRVHIFYQKETGLPFNNDERQLLYGDSKVRSQFGLSLAKLGDINKDGFMDLAVGAPYESDCGAVYIYLGAKNGLYSQPAQKIMGSIFKPLPLSFGFSLSGGLDMDNNEYPDLLVGAYKSDSIIYFRTRPVIKLPDLRFVSSSSQVNIEDKTCRLDTSYFSCIALTLCLTYDGIKVPQQIELFLTWSIDVEQMNSPRVSFINNSTVITSHVTLIKKQFHCTKQTAYLKPEIRDKLSPIVAILNYELIASSKSQSNRDLLPILDYFLPRNVTTNIEILKNCGEDDICVPNLFVTVKSLTPSYTQGSNHPVEMKVVIDNFGEDAFEAQVFIGIPQGLSYVNVYQLDGEKTMTCTVTGKELVICDIGNPLPSKNMVSFHLKLVASNLVNTSEELKISFHTRSANDEFQTDMANNNVTVRVPIQVMTDIRLSGVSKPSRLLINTTNKAMNRVNESELIHIYEVFNLGPSYISRVRVNISWPIYLFDGKALFNISMPPVITNGIGECFSNVENLPTSVNIYSVMNTSLSKTDSIKPGFGLKMKCDGQKQVPWYMCTTIQCDITLSPNSDHIVLEVHARILFPSLIHALGIFDDLVVTSSAIAEIIDVPYRLKNFVAVTEFFQVETYIEAIAAHKTIELLQFLMIFCAAVFMGCVTLFTIIAILYKCGFLRKRQLPEDMLQLHETKYVPEKNGNKQACYDDDYLQYEDGY